MARRLAPPTRRQNSGSGHVYYIDGTKADGVTTIIKGGVPKPALIGWAARVVAERVVERRHILTQLRDDEILNLLRGVPWEERDEAAIRGTEVHRLAAELARTPGAEVEIPDDKLGYVDAYRAWWEAWRPEHVIVEATVVNRKYRYAGTLDWLGHLPDLGLTLLDIKTGKSGVFAETALQLAAYGHAETIMLRDAAGTLVEHPMPEPETYGALWLTHDSSEFYVMDVGDDEYKAFLYAAGVHRWMKRRAGDKATEPVKGDALAPPSPAKLTVVNGGGR